MNGRETEREIIEGVDQQSAMEHEQEMLDIEALQANKEETTEEAASFSIFKKANHPVTLKVYMK